jgi:hypothetical protein
MSARFRTIAFQAIGVAVIAAIVYAAFLRPTDPGELSGIDAEGPGSVAASPETPGGDGKKKAPKGKGNDPKTKSTAMPPGLGGAGDDGQAGAPLGAAGPAGTGIPPVGGDTFPGDDAESPPVDQYDDLVARLMQRVGNPSLFKGFKAGR